MDEKLTLVLGFKNAANETVIINIENCKADLTKEQISPVMNEILSTNVLETKGGDLKSIEFAKIITKTEEEINMK